MLYTHLCEEPGPQFQLKSEIWIWTFWQQEAEAVVNCKINSWIRWSFKTSFSLSTITRNIWSQSAVILDKGVTQKAMLNRKTRQSMIAKLLESYLLLKRSHMKPKWNELL